MTIAYGSGDADERDAAEMLAAARLAEEKGRRREIGGSNFI